MLIHSLSSLWASGVDIMIHKLLVFKEACTVGLPTYVFDTKHCQYLPFIDVPRSHKPVKVVSTTSKNVKYGEVHDCISPYCEKVGSNFHIPVDSIALTSLREKVLLQYGIDMGNTFKSMITSGSTDLKSIVDYIVHNVNVLTNFPAYKNSAQPILPYGDNYPKQCVFICHAIDSKRFSFVPLATALSSVYKVYGLYVPITIHQQYNRRSISEIAVYFLEEIKLVQSEGPYTIAGFSFGAWIAHSIAKILQDQGETVSSLMLIDPVNLNDLTPSSTQSNELLLNIKTFFDFGSETLQFMSEKVFDDYVCKFQLQLEYLKCHRETSGM